MSEDAAIRRANLTLLCAQRHWTTADLHAELGWGRYSYWHDLISDPRKSFGEKVARHIEEKLELGRNWLDQDRDGHHRAEAPARDAAPLTPRLPFSVALVAALRKCDAAQLIKFENTLRALLGMPALPAGATARPQRGAPRPSERDFKFTNPSDAKPVDKALKRIAKRPDARRPSPTARRKGS